MINWIKERISLYHKDSDLNKISEAFDLVSKIYSAPGDKPENHRGFYKILFSLQPDDDTIIAAMLSHAYHNDLVEGDLIRAKFGNSVLKILDSVNRVLKVHYSNVGKNFQSEILHKLFLAMSKDVRVLLILLVTRLYNLQMIDGGMEFESLETFARENLEIYAPIASKLGIYKIRTKLEDLSFKYLFPEDYKLLDEQLKKFRKKNQISVDKLRKNVEDFLASKSIEASVSGRLKGVYSIYKKLKRKDYEQLGRLSDIVAIRIILKDNQYDQLYSILGHLHSHWTPVTKRFKDYVSVPKSNGYRSLHTVVQGMVELDKELPVEIQIRTHKMHLNAEYGVAAHWLYKDVGKSAERTNNKMEWINRLSQFYNEFLTNNNVVKKVDVNVFNDRIFVLTPNGEVKDLPVGSTPIDFAYLIHSDVGNHCNMAKVDGKAVPLDYKLASGQVVEIIGSRDARPKLEWLSKAHTQLAQRKIKAWFNQSNMDVQIKDGKRMLNKVLAELGRPLLDQNLSALKNFAGHPLNIAEREQLLSEIGQGTKSTKDIARKMYPSIGMKKIPNEEFEFKQLNEREKVQDKDVLQDIIVGGESDMPVKIASCCLPQPGDMILGYVTRGNSVTIHRFQCHLIDTLDASRLIFASWRSASNMHAGLDANLMIDVVLRSGLMKDISSILNDLDISLLDFHMKDKCISVKLSLKAESQLHKVIDRLSSLEGILSVSRVD